MPKENQEVINFKDELRAIKNDIQDQWEKVTEEQVQLWYDEYQKILESINVLQRRPKNS